MRSFLRFLQYVIALVVFLAPMSTPAQAAQEGSGVPPQQIAPRQPQQDNTAAHSAISKIAGVAPVVTAIGVLLFGLLTWRFNERSIRRLARQDHIRILVEIDKNLIQYPELWRIYSDEYPPQSATTDPSNDHARRKALIYLFLNMFEAEFDFDRHLQLAKFQLAHFN